MFDDLDDALGYPGNDDPWRPVRILPQGQTSMMNYDPKKPPLPPVDEDDERWIQEGGTK